MYNNSILKFSLLFTLLFSIALEKVLGAATINNEDGQYDPIQIKIPLNVWQKALRPTPVLKSTATIVVPIQVSSDNEYEDEEIDENEDDDDNEILENQTEADDNTSTDVPAEPSVTTAVTTAAIPTQQQEVQDDETSTISPAVPGQVTRFPCSCRNGQCGCCTGTLLQSLNMRTCGNISFVPEDFIFDVKLSVNNRTVLRRRVSASDPPPICFNPRRAPFVRVCAEISNIRIRNRNAFACLDINADIEGFNVYSAPFRCFGLGTSGVQTGLKPKPVSSGPTPVNLYGTRDEEDDDDGPGGFIGDVAGGIFGGGDSEGGGFLDRVQDGIFGGGGSSDDDDSGGPFDAIGDVFDGIGDFLDTRKRLT